MTGSWRSMLTRFALPLAAAIMLVSGCGPAGDSSHESTLTIAYGFDERVLGPTANMPAQFLVFEPLVAYDDRYEVEGRLARGWEHSPDYRDWTIHLRTDVRWHDGEPFTAHDVKFTLDLMAHPDVSMTGSGTEIRVLDDSTYTLSFGRPVNALNSWTVYFPRHLLEGLDPARFHDWDFWTQPVGNGPFKYVRHRIKEMIELEANPDYYRGRPRLDRIRLRLGERSVTQLLSGEVDVIPYFGQAEAAPVANDSRFVVYSTVAAARTRVIVWNHRHPAFGDPAVRRALTLAIDRRTLYRILHIPDEVPVIDAVFTYGQFRRREFPEPFPHDPTEAAALLDAAGWRDSDGDGVRDLEGRPFRFELIATGDDQRAAVFVQNQLRRIGVAAEIRSLDFGAAGDRVLSGRFDAAISVAQLQNVVGRRGLADLLGEDSPLGYESPELNALLALARDSVDPEVLDSVFREVTEILRADLPLTVLVPFVWSTVADRRVRGLVSPHRVDPVWHAFDLWVEDDR